MTNLRSSLKFAFAFLITVGFLSDLLAQNYQSAAGLRLGRPVAVSYKFFPGNHTNAFELTLGTFGNRHYAPYYDLYDPFDNYSFRAWGLGATYQIHGDLNTNVDVLDNLQWFAGAGASAYIWSFNRYYYFTEQYSRLSFGIVGTVGLDYKFEDLPINVSVDWSPIFFFNGFANGFRAGYGAITARYVLSE